MLLALSQNWWVLALRGAIALLFGILVFLWPMLAWVMVVATFAAFALVDGFIAMMMAFSGEQGQRWWALLIEGVFGIAAGVLTIFWPGMTQLALLFIIAYWAIATGVFEVIAAIRLRKEIEGEWLLAFSGILSVLFGMVLVILPAAGAVAIAWLIAAYSIVFGVLMIALSLRLRSLTRRVSRASGAALP